MVPINVRIFICPASETESLTIILETVGAGDASNQPENDGVRLQEPVASHDAPAHGTNSPPKSPSIKLEANDAPAHGTNSPPKSPSKLEANQTENPSALTDTKEALPNDLD
jgi:hypothetical protein